MAVPSYNSAFIPKKVIVSAVAVVDTAVISILSLAGTYYGIAAIVGTVVLGILAFSQIGLVLCVTLISHISSIPGIDFDTLRLTKWLVLLALLWVTTVRILSRSERIDIKFGAIEKSVLAFILWGLVCTIFAIRPFESLAALLRLATLPFLFLVARYTITRTSHVRIIIGIILVVVFTTSIFSFAGVLSGHFGRASGFLDNPNSLGILMIFCLPVLLIAMIVYRYISVRIFLALGLAMGAATLLMSWSRASILAAFGIIIVFLILENRKLLFILLGMLTISAIVILSSSDIFTQFSDLSRLQFGLTRRSILWEHGMHAVAKNPILGHGFVVHTEDVREKATWTGVSEAMTMGSNKVYGAHNFYVHIAVSAGIPGLILMTIVYFNLFRLPIKCRQRSTKRSHRLLFSMIIAVIAGSLLNSMFETGPIFGSGSTANYFWVTLGMAAAMSDKNIDF